MSTLIELRTDVRANLASQTLARIEAFTRCTYGEALDHSGQCQLEVPADVAFLAGLQFGRVLRITDTSIPRSREYRIHEIAEGTDAATLTTTARHVIHDLNRYFLWESVGGIPTLALAATDLTAEEWFDTYIQPTLIAAGVTYVVRDTFDSTRKLNLDWQGQTVLWLLQQLVDGTTLDIEYEIQDVGAVQEKYAVRLIQRGQTAPSPTIIVGQPGVELLRWTQDGEIQANVLIPQGKTPAGGTDPTNIGEYAARVAAVSGNDLTLEDPDGNVPPVYQTDQVTGLYLEMLIPPLNAGALS